MPPPTSTAEEAFCDFGSQPTTAFCEWQNGPGALEWTSGSGTNANWLGGPSVDATNSGSSEGGLDNDKFLLFFLLSLTL